MQNIFNQLSSVSETKGPKIEKNVEVITQVPVKPEKLAMQAKHVSSIHCLSHRLRWIEVDLTCSAMALAALLPCLQVSRWMGEGLQTKDAIES